MVKLNQVQAGLAKFVDAEILPQLDGIKRLGFGTYFALASGNIAATIKKYASSPGVEVLDIVKNGGEDIDIDKLYEVLQQQMKTGEKYTMDIPLIGSLSLNKADLEKIVWYIKES